MGREIGTFTDNVSTNYSRFLFYKRILITSAEVLFWCHVALGNFPAQGSFQDSKMIKKNVIYLYLCPVKLGLGCWFRIIWYLFLIYLLIKRPIDDIYFLIFLLVERGMDTQHVYRWCCKKRPTQYLVISLKVVWGYFEVSV